MDDDHEFPDRHWEHVEVAVKQDPEVVWTIGEFPEWSGILEPPPPCPGQLHPRGFSYPPKDPRDYWGISDGASIYPKKILELAGPMEDRFRFGASYLEYGSRIKFVGGRVRHLESTFVIHHLQEVGRSHPEDAEWNASRIYAMWMHSFWYFPTVKNMSLTLLQTAWEFVREPRMAAFILQELRTKVK